MTRNGTLANTLRESGDSGGSRLKEGLREAEKTDADAVAPLTETLGAVEEREKEIGGF